MDDEDFECEFCGIVVGSQEELDAHEDECEDNPDNEDEDEE